MTKTGYAAGTVYGGEWLTVWGSAYRSDLVYPTAEQAEERASELRARSVPAQAARVQVRRVEALGGIYFRILPEPQPQPTDAELLAAIDRGIEAGALTEVTDEWLAERMAELDAEDTAEVARPVTIPAKDLTPGDRVRGPVGKPFPIGPCTVAMPLTPARRGGRQVGYRVRLTGPDGTRLAPWVAGLDLLLELAAEAPSA